MAIIGISGAIGAGKDTLGMYLQALSMRDSNATRWASDPIGYEEAYRGTPNLKGGWDIKKFAYKLKLMASLFLGVSIEKFEDQTFKDSILGREWSTAMMMGSGLKQDGFNGPKTSVIVDMTVREFLQKLGKGARDSVHVDVWVNALFADYPPSYTERVMTDAPIPGKNWIITDVRYPNEAKAIKSRGGIIIRIERPDNPFPESNHESETALKDWSFDSYINNTSLEYLVERAADILKLHEHVR